MQNSIYYNLKLVEGTDIVNPLTVDVPNYGIIDEQMHNNSVASVGFATELANGSTHAITRENSECSVFRFIATARWKLGDNVSVDGVPVSALLPSGETLPAGSYVINANVLCILTGTILTIYTEGNKTEYANEIKYNATTVESELNKLNSDLQFGIYERGFTVNSGQPLLLNQIPNGYKLVSCTIGFEGSKSSELDYTLNPVSRAVYVKNIPNDSIREYSMKVFEIYKKI